MQRRSAVTFREARQDERRRAESLFGARRHRDGSKYFVAVAPHPVERIVAVASWGDSAIADEMVLNVRFDWMVIPGWRTAGFPADVLQEFLRHLRGGGRRSLRAQRLVDPRSWEADAFRAAGFDVIARHEHFKLEYAPSRVRHERIYKRFQVQRLPAGRSIESINVANSGAAAKLVQQHGLLAPARFWEGIRRGEWQEYSSLLLHEGEAEGVLLAAASGVEDVSIYVLAANRTGGASTGLVCNVLFESLRERCDAAGVAGIYFWAEPHRSPATRRLALRFGGRVVGETVQFGLYL